MGANFDYALSTLLRQLGLAMRILSVGFPKLAYFHLLTHSLFKVLLFIEPHEIDLISPDPRWEEIFFKCCELGGLYFRFALDLSH